MHHSSRGNGLNDADGNEIHPRQAHIIAIAFIVNSKASCSESATAATTLSTGRVRRDGGNILNATDLETISGKGTNGRLGTGSGGLGHNTTLSTKLDVDSVDANSLELTANVDGGKHSGVGGGLFSVSLDLHTTGDTGVGFTAGEIGDVNEGVVEVSLQVANTEDVLRLLGLTELGGTVVGNTFFLGFTVGELFLLSLGQFGL